ncbi:MAG: tRNA pseudouridine(38-40) synthase TruA, partial [Planctomycetota bacterium]
MPRLRLLVAYDGTDFHGWQRQVPPNLPELRTAQGVLTQAVHDLFGAAVPVLVASRTDAGVHARGQVASFSIDQLRIPVDRV